MFGSVLDVPLKFTDTQLKLNFASGVIAQVCLGDDYNDIIYNYTYLYDIEIGFDFYFFL